MDSESDFLTPEFLNILFFSQSNLVIFPYADLKNLHVLDVFTTGYNVIEMESTALYDVRMVLESEANNSYSQTPSLYLIYNLEKKDIPGILELENIRCIINTKDDVSNLANGARFIFYNKKARKFINYSNGDLAFENRLINTSPNVATLQDNLLKVKTTATCIYTSIMETGISEGVPEILAEIEPEYWQKVLRFTELFFDINIPELPEQEASLICKAVSKRGVSDRVSGDFEQEYNTIIQVNPHLRDEFIQLLFEYRIKHVNPSNLELDQLHQPNKTYAYLREHHWEASIPNDVLYDWI